MILAAATFVVLWSSEAWAYTVNCNGTRQAKIITSVLGEARPANGSSAGQFHTGTDIADCQTGFTVLPIEPGTEVLFQCNVDQEPKNCEIRIQNGTHAFDYIHLFRDSIL